MRQRKILRLLQEVDRTADVDREVDIRYLRRLVMRRLRGSVTMMAKSALYRREEILTQTSTSIKRHGNTGWQGIEWQEALTELLKTDSVGAYDTNGGCRV